MPGEIGVWVFILGDLLIFGALFATYLFYRADDAGLFMRSQLRLDRDLGMANTLILLTSSWCVALAVQQVRVGAGRTARRWMTGAIACGLGFVAIKSIEYGAKGAEGIDLTTNTFFMFYFIMTGIHLLHLLLGLGLLFFVWRRMPASFPDNREILLIETGASFWHLVDLLWIVLFPLLYLLH